jgi:hypothetical protein
MLSNGILIDLTVLSDFHRIKEIRWLSKSVGTLYVTDLTLHKPGAEWVKRLQNNGIVQPIRMTDECMYKIFRDINREYPLVGETARMNIAISQCLRMRYATDDAPIVKVCIEKNIHYVRTLDLLSRMITSQYKTKQQVVQIMQNLVELRGYRDQREGFENWAGFLLHHKNAC